LPSFFFFAGFRHGSRYGHNFNGYSLRAKGLEQERKSEKIFLVSDYIDKKTSILFRTHQAHHPLDACH